MIPIKIDQRAHQENNQKARWLAPSKFPLLAAVALSPILALVSVTSFATTFVGNGGDGSDYELNAAITRIQKSLRYIDKNRDMFKPHEQAVNMNERSPDDDFVYETLCTCDSSAQTNMCSSLVYLTTKKSDYCHTFILKNSKKLLSMIANNTFSFEWVSSDIQIKHNHSSEEKKKKNSDVSENKKEPRNFDAGVSHDKKIIYINKSKFLDLSGDARVALIGHELGHLLQNENGYIDDDAAAGPYSSGREFLNVFGASLAVIGPMYMPYREEKTFSRAWKKYYFGFRGIERDERNTGLSFIDRKQSGSSFHIAYIPSFWGIYGETGELSSSGESGSEASGSTPSSKLYEESSFSYTKVGALYRWIPLNHKERWYSQIGILFKLGYLFGSLSASVADDFIKFEEDIDTGGVAAEVEIKIPIIHGFWFDIGSETVFANEKWKTFDVESNRTNHLINLGV